MVRYTLTLTTSGTGSGTIQASPAGPYYYGASVTIWANASVGSTFTGFTGCFDWYDDTSGSCDEWE